MADTVLTGDHSNRLVANSLLNTKLFIPQVRNLQDFLSRPRLVQRLQDGLARKLTLISAPAGYGKTMLLAEWISQSDRPVAWLALDETDNDLPRFLTYVVAALQRLKAGFGESMLVALQSPQPPNVEGLITTLVNEVDCTFDPFVLVLDDYHLIHLPEIHAAIAFLLNHQPPTLHLMLISRADPPLPLARLRVRGQLNEVRAADLRFTLEEATTFFHQVRDLQLSAGQIKELESRTEGWGAGLHLASLSLQGIASADISRFIGDFTGSHHNVFDYLAEDVFQQQPPEVQRFLLLTSILSRLCASLCDAILSKEAGAQGGGEMPNSIPAPAQSLLEYLEHANLFLVPLDNWRRWYRYHHLFADFLRQRLARESGQAEINDLYRRASGWFEQQELLPEAVNYALAAGDGALAARLIEPQARSMQLRGEMATVMGWLAALPEAELRVRPQLGLVAAWGLATTGQVLAAEQRLQLVEQALNTPDERANLLGEAMVIRARIALIQGNYVVAAEQAHQALTYLPEAQVPLRALTYVSLGSARMGLYDLESAAHNLAHAIALYQSIDQPEQALLPLRQLARVQLSQGRLKQLEQSSQEALRLVATWGQRSPLVGYTYLSLGDLYYERNDLTAALNYFTDGLALIEPGGTQDVMNLLNLADAHMGLARIKHAQGDPQGALELTQRVEPLWEMLGRTIQQRAGAGSITAREGQAGSSRSRAGVVAIYFDRIAAYRVRIWLSQGNIAAANEWAQGIDWQAEEKITALQEHRLIAWARVRIAQGELVHAITLLARLIETLTAAGRLFRVIELLALQAIALHAHGQEAAAFAALEDALRMGEPEGYIRTFVDEGPPLAHLLMSLRRRTTAIPLAYLETLLAAFPAFGLPPSPQERTTTRESAPPHLALTPPIPPPLINLPREPLPAARLPAQAAAEALVEPLSKRELEILSLIAQGFTNTEIGQQIYISDQTVKVHTRNIYGKLGVNSRREAVAKARQMGLLA